MAFRKRTVFIVGAGASVDLDFDTGPKLLKTIGQMLDYRYDRYTRTSGDGEIEQIFRALCANLPHSELEAHISCARRLSIAAAAETAKSIDNAIDQNDDDPRIALIGKLAIAKAILEQESKSKLKSKKDGSDLSVSDGHATWLHALGVALVSDVQKSRVGNIFDNVKIITFNYDRSLERYLPTFLAAAYGMDISECERLVNELEIIHPYGTVGKLPWQSTDLISVNYGGPSRSKLLEISGNILTFTESCHKDISNRVHNAMSWAQQLVFLGFGYHRQNMRLLSPPERIEPDHVFGTAFGLSPSAKRAARHSIAELVFELHLQATETLEDQKCYEFLRDFEAELTS